jgi:hypothetical protein
MLRILKIVAFGLFISVQLAVLADYLMVVRPATLCAHATAERNAPYMEQLIQLHQEWLRPVTSSEKGHVQ